MASEQEMLKTVIDALLAILTSPTASDGSKVAAAKELLKWLERND